MATMKTKLQVLSKMNMVERQQRNDWFQRECVTFLETSLKKVLLIGTSSLLGDILLKFEHILDKSEDLKQRYGQGENQMFLKWTQLRSVTSDVEYLPKLPNLVVLEFDKTTVDEQDMSMCKKLAERLSLGSWKKIVIISHKEQGLKKFFLKNIDSKVMCILDEECEIEDIEEKSERTSKLPPKRMKMNTVLCVKSPNLYKAASEGNLDDVAFFIETGVDIDQADVLDKNTPLHKAAEKVHAGVVLKLLQHRAKHLQNSEKVTPLHLASEKGHHVVVEILIEYDADIDAKNVHEQTALHWAASNGHDIIVKTLLKYGAKVDNIDKSRYTPLHFAVQNNHLEVVKLLVLENANLECKNNGGNTPLDIAKRKGHRTIEEYLTSKGAKSVVLGRHRRYSRPYRSDSYYEESE